MSIERMKMHGFKFRKPALKMSVLSTALIMLAACSGDKSTDLQDNIVETAANGEKPVFIARFKLSSNGNVIPFPNNLLFAGSVDGTLNIPATDDDTEGSAALKASLNTLDGFSTVSPITTTFNDYIDKNTVVAGTSVRVFEVTLSGIGGAVVAINSELGVSDFVATVGSDQKTLVVLPLKPLKAKSSYLVAVTNAVTNTASVAAKADLMYEIVKNGEAVLDTNNNIQFNAFKDPRLTDAENIANATKIEQIRLLTNLAEANVQAYTVTNDASDLVADLNKSDIVISWTFTTQSTEDVLQAVKAIVNDDSFEPVSAIMPAVVGSTPAPSGLEADSRGNIYIGSLEVPYYLTAFSSNNPTAPLTEYWRADNGGYLTAYNSTPSVTSTQTIPLFITVPKNGVAPWPVVIFQHGISRNRTDLLGIANTLASQGFAAVAIDLPLHGLVGDEELVGAFKTATENFDPDVTERHFEMDLINNDTLVPGEDGKLDKSELNFINLRSPLTSRDNVRQAVADLMVLRKAIKTMNYDGIDNGPDFDSNRVFFVGQSLGSIVGATYLALNDASDTDESVKTSVLSTPGGGIAKMLDGSASFGPAIQAGLAAEGVIKGTADYDSFMAIMQAALDSADPINYTSQIGANRGILLYEVVGGGTATGEASLTDQVIPNSVADAPLSGTTPLASYMGLTKTALDKSSLNPQKLWVRFTEGHHSSLLTPKNIIGEDDAVTASVTTEMQSQMASFLLSNGLSLNVTNTGVLKPVQ